MDARSIKDESSDYAVIKVRTPNQLNDSVQSPSPTAVQAALEKIRRQGFPQRRHSVHPGSQMPTPSPHHYVSLNNKVVVKRLGNTTISTARNGQLSPSLVKQSAPAFRQLVSHSGNLVRLSAAPATNQSTTATATSSQLPSSIAASDPRDHIIAKLQEQNRELKRALIDIRSEGNEIIYRTNRWTARISQILNKLQSIPSSPTSQQQGQQTSQPAQVMLGPRTKITARKSTSPMQSPYIVRDRPSPPQQQQVTTEMRRYVQRLAPKPPVMTTKSITQQAPPIRIVRQPQQTESSQPPRGVTRTVAYRSPVFPVKEQKILGLLECNLYQSQYFVHVKRNTFTLVQNLEITKPTQMLDSVLKTLIHEDLLKKFVVGNDLSHRATNDTTRPPSWRAYPMIRDLFNSVVNMISMRKFSKKVDPLSIDQFLKNKVLKNLSAQQKPPSVSATVTVSRSDNPDSTTTFIRRLSPPSKPPQPRFSPPKLDENSNGSASTGKSSEHADTSKMIENDEINEAEEFALEDEEAPMDEDEEGYEEFEEEMFTFEDDEVTQPAT